MWRAFSMTALGALAALSLNGCVAKDCKTESGADGVCLETPVRYDDGTDDTTLFEDYFPGMDLSIDGIYGNIEVVEGEAGRIAATFKPFAYAGKSDEAAAFAAIHDESVMDLAVDGDTIVVRSDRADNEIPLVGIDLEIALPPEFDGALVATNRSRGTWNPGDVGVRFSGLAPSIEVTAGALSDCEVRGNPDVIYTYVHCDDTVRVLDVNDDVDLLSSGAFGTVQLALSGISSDASRDSVLRAEGDVSVTFPSNASFSVQAQATAPGVVDEGDLPDTCSLAASDITAKSLTCGDGGPLYTVSSGGNVRLTVF